MADSDNDEKPSAATEHKFSVTYDERLKHVTAIAKPMAPEKLTVRLLKLIGKAKRRKGYLRPGLKEVQKRIRKGERGLVVLAGDSQPIDCMAHIPAVCEEKDIPYCYIPSRQDIGIAMQSRRKVMMAMVLQNDEYKKLYEKCRREMGNLELPVGL